MQLDLIKKIPENSTGFVLGNQLGQYKIIENFFPVSFTSLTIDTVYHKMFSCFGTALIGVFFNQREPFLHDWFMEDIIFHIQDESLSHLYYYDGEKKFQLLPR